MIKAVIFDLNGIFLISDFLSVRFEEKYKVPQEKFVLALKAVMDTVRKPNAPAAYSLWERYFDIWGLALTEKEFFDFWFSGEKLDPSLVDYIDELKGKGLKVFILSNNFKERTEYYQRSFPNFFSKFDGVYFSWETGFVKPSEETYLNLLKENSLSPQESIYFDDADKNIEVARNLGINSHKYENLEETRKIIESLLKASPEPE